MKLLLAVTKKIAALRKFIFRFGNSHYKLDTAALVGLSLHYKRPKWYFVSSYIYCSYRYGCDMRQYMLFEMYKLKHHERRQFITRYNKFRLYRKFNWQGKDQRVYFDDKHKFNSSFSKFIQRDWLYASDRGPEEILSFIRGRDRIVAKPTGAMGGKGVSVLSTQNLNTEEFVKQACQEKLLLEEYVEQCKELAALNASSVNTIRVVSVRDNKDRLQIVSAALRVGKPGARVDNLSAGGVLYPLDVCSGCVNGPGVDDRGNQYLVHCDNSMLGFEIPRWDEVASLVKQAMGIFPSIRMVAWDISITPQSVELVEGNLMPGARSLQADKQGKRELLLGLLNNGK